MIAENKPTERKTVGIWVRVSTQEQANGDSPLHHEKRARAYAESRDWIVGEMYDLSGVSGKSVADHPEAKRMLEDVRTGKITGLIFSKIARLARNTRELLDFADFFREHEADLVSLQEAIDTSTSAGRLFYTMIAGMAQWERDETSERVKASVPIRAKLGKNTGGQATFGYRWVDSALEPDPNEAPVRKLVYELFLEHRRKKTVARVLNEQGYRTRSGAKFSDTTITRLLRDPTAKGEHRANYTTSNGRGKSAKLKPREDWVIQKVEPIVTEDLWNACNAILAQQAGKKRPGRTGTYLFAGKVVCTCGTKMYVKTGTKKFLCGGCRNKIPMDDLEAVFRDELRAFFANEDELAKVLGDTDEAIQDLKGQVDVLKAERKSVMAEVDRLYRSYIDKELEGSVFNSLYQPLLKRREEIDDTIPGVEGRVDSLTVARLASEDIIEGARDLYDRWDQLPFEDKVTIVEAIVDDIRIGDTDIVINLHYVPTSELTDTKHRNGRDSSRQLAGNAPDRRYGHWPAPR